HPVRKKSAKSPQDFDRSHRRSGVPVLPETDLHRIRLWARGRVPAHLWDELKVEADVADRHVTIVEVRPPWDGVGEHTRFPIARLRYTRTTGLWSIYWRDRNLKFHEYKRKPP